MISATQIKELRDRTGLPMGQCKQALEQAAGDPDKALAALKAAGAAVAEKKAGRTLGAGRIGSYLHTTGTIGGMVALACETDFVAKTDDFRGLAQDLAMQVVGFNPADLAELLAQPFIKDANVTVAERITGAVQKLGERVEIARFARFEI